MKFFIVLPEYEKTDVKADLFEKERCQWRITLSISLKQMIEPIDLILKELKLAEQKHPGFPTDPIHMVAIMAEETGESIQVAIDLVYNDGDFGKLITEVAQSGAMAIRVLMNLRAMDETKWKEAL